MMNETLNNRSMQQTSLNVVVESVSLNNTQYKSRPKQLNANQTYDTKNSPDRTGKARKQRQGQGESGAQKVLVAQSLQLNSKKQELKETYKTLAQRFEKVKNEQLAKIEGGGASASREQSSPDTKRVAQAGLQQPGACNNVDENLVIDDLDTSLKSDSVKRRDQVYSHSARRYEKSLSQHNESEWVQASGRDQSSNRGGDRSPHSNEKEQLREIREYESKLRGDGPGSASEHPRKAEEAEADEAEEADEVEAEEERIGWEDQLNEEEKMWIERSATVIQSVWRGFLARREIHLFLEQQVNQNSQGEEEVEESPHSNEQLNTEDLNMFRDESMEKKL